MKKEMEELVKFFEGGSWNYVKYGNGQAYYMIDHKEHTSALDWNTVNIWHMLSGVRYPATKSSLRLVNFIDMPYNYQLDAIALNPLIRRLYEDTFTHIQKDSQMSKEWENFYKKTNSAFESFKSEFAKRPISQPTITAQQFNNCEDSSGSMNTNATILQQKEKNNSMSLLSKIPGLNISFGTLEKGLVALDFQGNLAFKDKASGGYISLQKNPDGSKVQVHTGDLKFDVPFYTIPTKDLEVGDLVLIDGGLLIVEEKQKGGFKFVNPVTGNTSSKIERTNILNMFFYTKVVSMFNMVGGSTEGGIGLGNLDPMTLMLLSQSGEGGLGGGSNIAELMVMSQLFGGQGAGTMNPMMLMMLAGKGESGMDGMLPLLLMSQGGGGLFGQKPAAKKAAPKRAPKKAAIAKKKTASPRKRKAE